MHDTGTAPLVSRSVDQQDRSTSPGQPHGLGNPLFAPDSPGGLLSPSKKFRSTITGPPALVADGAVTTLESTSRVLHRDVIGMLAAVVRTTDDVRP